MSPTVESTRSQWKAAFSSVAMLILVLIAVGSVVDLFYGLPLLASSRSWAVWIVGVLALGTLYLLGEGSVEWINAQDKASHPLWRRAWSLVLLLGTVVLASIAAGKIIQMSR